VFAFLFYFYIDVKILRSVNRNYNKSENLGGTAKHLYPASSLDSTELWDAGGFLYVK